MYIFLWFFILSVRKGCICHPNNNNNKKKKKEKKGRGVRQRLFPPPTDDTTWEFQGVDCCLRSPTSRPDASDSVPHSFSDTAIHHGLDTRLLRQRNPYNRLTVIKETSLQSNKISNSQLYQGRLPVSGVVLFTSFFRSISFSPPSVSFWSIQLGFTSLSLTSSFRAFLIHMLCLSTFRKQSFNYLC